MRNLDTRFYLAAAAVLVWLIADAGMAVSGGFDLGGSDASGAFATASLARTANLIGLVTSVFYTLAFIVSVVFVAMWVHRANANAHAVSDRMTMSPGWNVGFFFIPIATLFKPFQGLRETWQASVSPDAPDQVTVPAMMRWWWGLWIVSNILGNISLRLSLNSDPVLAIRLVGWLGLLSFVIDVPMTVLLILFMRQLTVVQRRFADVPPRSGPAAGEPLTSG